MVVVKTELGDVISLSSECWVAVIGVTFVVVSPIVVSNVASFVDNWFDVVGDICVDNFSVVVFIFVSVKFDKSISIVVNFDDDIPVVKDSFLVEVSAVVTEAVGCDASFEGAFSVVLSDVDSVEIDFEEGDFWMDVLTVLKDVDAGNVEYCINCVEVLSVVNSIDVIIVVILVIWSVVNNIVGVDEGLTVAANVVESEEIWFFDGKKVVFNGDTPFDEGLEANEVSVIEIDVVVVK